MSEPAGNMDAFVKQPQDEPASTTAAECDADASVSTAAAGEPVKTHDTEDSKAQASGGERTAPAGTAADDAGSTPKLSKNALKKLKKDQAWAVCHYCKRAITPCHRRHDARQTTGPTRVLYFRRVPRIDDLREKRKGSRRRTGSVNSAKKTVGFAGTSQMRAALNILPPYW